MSDPSRKPHLEHIAALVRDYIEREKITVQQMAVRLGRDRLWTGVYPWIGARSAPIGEGRTKLAELLGVDENVLLPKGEPSAHFRGSEMRVARKAGPPFVERLEQQLIEVQPPAAMPRAAPSVLPAVKDVLTYGVDSEGQATIRLAVRGPHSRMAALFRLLLDAGLVPSGEEEQPG
jgi:hypothetical protein